MVWAGKKYKLVGLPEIESWSCMPDKTRFFKFSSGEMCYGCQPTSQSYRYIFNLMRCLLLKVHYSFVDGVYLNVKRPNSHKVEEEWSTLWLCTLTDISLVILITK